MPSMRFKRPDTLLKCPNRVCFTLVTRQTIDGALEYLRRFEISQDRCRLEYNLLPRDSVSVLREFRPVNPLHPWHERSVQKRSPVLAKEDRFPYFDPL